MPNTMQFVYITHRMRKIQGVECAINLYALKPAFIYRGLEYNLLVISEGVDHNGYEETGVFLIDWTASPYNANDWKMLFNIREHNITSAMHEFCDRYINTQAHT